MLEINLNEWEKFGGGVEADAYNKKDDDKVMLKLFNFKDEQGVKIVADNTKLAIEAGIKTPQVIDIAKTQDKYGIIFERVKNKISLLRKIVNDESIAYDVGIQFGTFLKELHKVKLDKNKVPFRGDVLKYTYNVLIDRNENLTTSEKDDLKNKALEFTKQFDIYKDEDTYIVGDAHVGNVIESEGKLYLIDLGTITRGTKYFDLAWIYGSLYNSAVEKAIPTDNKVSQVAREKLYLGAMHGYLGTKDENELEKLEEKLKPFAKIQQLMIVLFIGKSYEDIISTL